MLKAITEAGVISSASRPAAPSSGKAFQHLHKCIKPQATELGIKTRRGNFPAQTGRFLLQLTGSRSGSMSVKSFCPQNRLKKYIILAQAMIPVLYLLKQYSQTPTYSYFYRKNRNSRGCSVWARLLLKITTRVVIYHLSIKCSLSAR